MRAVIKIRGGGSRLGAAGLLDQNLKYLIGNKTPGASESHNLEIPSVLFAKYSTIPIQVYHEVDEYNTMDSGVIYVLQHIS